MIMNDRLLELVVLTCLSTIHAIPIENGVVGDPTITCGASEISIEFDTQNTFEGNVYVKGLYGSEECRNRATSSINLPFESCNVRRTRSLNPKGVFVSSVVIISFHPQFITKVDRAYRIECFYMEADKTVSSQLEVSMLTTEFRTQNVPMPVCRYEVLKGGPDGDPVTFAIVGEPVYHKWTCDTETVDTFCMRVHSCTVEDSQGQNKQALLDDQGCTLDIYLLNTPEYPTNLMAGVEAHVFKYADRAQLFFQCQISILVKEPEVPCLPPPNCELGTAGVRLTPEEIIKEETKIPFTRRTTPTPSTTQRTRPSPSTETIPQTRSPKTTTTLKTTTERRTSTTAKPTTIPSSIPTEPTSSSITSSTPTVTTTVKQTSSPSRTTTTDSPMPSQTTSHTLIETTITTDTTTDASTQAPAVVSSTQTAVISTTEVTPVTETKSITSSIIDVTTTGRTSPPEITSSTPKIESTTESNTDGVTSIPISSNPITTISSSVPAASISTTESSTDGKTSIPTSSSPATTISSTVSSASISVTESSTDGETRIPTSSSQITTTSSSVPTASISVTDSDQTSIKPTSTSQSSQPDVSTTEPDDLSAKSELSTPRTSPVFQFKINNGFGTTLLPTEAPKPASTSVDAVTTTIKTAVASTASTTLGNDSEGPNSIESDQNVENIARDNAIRSEKIISKSIDESSEEDSVLVSIRSSKPIVDFRRKFQVRPFTGNPDIDPSIFRRDPPPPGVEFHRRFLGVHVRGEPDIRPQPLIVFREKRDMTSDERIVGTMDVYTKFDTIDINEGADPKKLSEMLSRQYSQSRNGRRLVNGSDPIRRKHHNPVCINYYTIFVVILIFGLIYSSFLAIYLYRRSARKNARYL